MTLALRELQAAFAAHLQGEQRPGLAALVGDARRLSIHRHHVARSLAKTLAATFPTVQALVGADFFRQLAEAFIARSLPTQPVLAEYGADFAGFLADEETMHGLPYLAEIGHLDWALNVAFYSPRRSAPDLSGVAPATLLNKVLALAPGAALVHSRYPIDRIWAASQPDASEGEVDLAEGPTSLLVLPGGFIRLGDGEAAFVGAIALGEPLERAAGAAFAAESGFDLPTCFARLLACEAFAAAQQ